MSDKEYIPAAYHLEGKNLEVVLGPLESKIMQLIWTMNTPIRVREVYEALQKEGYRPKHPKKGKEGEERKIAYTTVMTTMNTLFEKGLLDREVGKGRGGLLYLYRPKRGQAEIEQSVVKHVIQSLMENFGDSVTAYLMEAATSDEEKIKAFKKLFEAQLNQESE